MIRRRATALALAVTVAAVAAALSCRREALPTVYDLGALADVADVEGPWQLVRPWTIAGRLALASGFDPAPAEHPVPHVVARRQASWRVILDEAGERTAVLDIEPMPGTSRLGVRLNGRRIARLDLQPGRTRYAFELPASQQAAGVNTVDLRFDEGIALGEGEPRYAARVFGLGVVAGPAASAALAPLYERADGAVTVPPGSLTWGVVVPEAARLQLAAAVDGASGRLLAEWHPDGGEPARIWSKDVEPGERTEVDVELAVPAGTSGRLRLAFASDERVASRVRWQQPRLVGHGQGPALVPPPFTPEQNAAAEPLRQATAGAPLVLVVLDAARAAQLGVYGNPRPTSPRIDALARDGVVFDRAYTSAVFTLAAMSTLWTSLEPTTHHAGVPYDDPLPPEHLTLAELLGAAGRPTAGFVGNARAGAAYGMQRGFATYVEARQQSVGAGAEELVAGARAFLRDNAGSPFFLYVHLREPHFPYDPPAPWSTLFGPSAPLPPEALRDPDWYRAANESGTLRPEHAEALLRAYERNLAYADARVGELFDELTALGLMDRAVVMVTSDHGEALWEHGFISHNEQVYEESTRIPLILKLPTSTGTAGRRLSALVTTQDVAPTFADAAGLTDRARAFRGRSLLPLVAGAAGRPAAVTRAAGEDSLYAVRLDRWKCLVDTRWGGEQLYDLRDDPAEQRDLRAEAPGRLLACRQALHRHLLDLKPRALTGSRRPELDPERLENLRALGYVE